MIGYVSSLLFPTPYQQQLYQYDQNPDEFIFDETQVNEQMSHFLESIEWNIASLPSHDARARYFRIFKEHATALTFVPYYFTRGNCQNIALRIVETFNQCPNLKSIESKKGVYNSQLTSGILLWEKPIFTIETATNFYSTILATSMSVENGIQPKLQSLRIRSYHKITPDMLDAITNTNPKLSSLRVCVRRGDQRTFDVAIGRLEKMNNLKLHSDNLNDGNLPELLKRSPKLEKLNIGSKNLSSYSFIRIAHLAELQFLKISGLEKVQIKDFEFLKKNKKLTHFKINSMSYENDILEVIAKFLSSHLTVLCLNWSRFPDTLRAVSCLKTFVNLTNFSMKLDNELAPEDRVIPELANAVPTLQTIDMEYWELSAEHVAQFELFKQLRHLTIGNFPGCEMLNDAIEKLKENNLKLVVENISYKLRDHGNGY